jgi:hypothetical protein
METYDYVIYVQSKYGEANNHQELIELIEQIRVEREGAKYTITLHKI